jgi:hypothetical protein
MSTLCIVLLSAFDIYTVINENRVKLFYIYVGINENGMKKKAVKYYYVGVNKANNSVIVCSTKAELGRFIGISVFKLSKMMDNITIVDTELFTLWSRIRITKVNRGWRYK